MKKFEMLGESPKGDTETDRKTEVFVAQLCPTLFNSMDHSPPQAPLSMGFSRQKHWSGLPFPSPGDRRIPRIEPASLMSPALAGRFFTTSATWEAKFMFIHVSDEGLVLQQSTAQEGRVSAEFSCNCISRN